MIEFAGIAPHGFSIIEEIAGHEMDLFKPTRDSMELFGELFKTHQLDTIIILTPHGLRLKGHHAIYLSEYCRGSLEQFGKEVHVEFKCDIDLAKQILSQMEEERIPLVGCNYGAISGPLSNIEMDWGTLIPLWFCGAQDEGKPELIVIGPTRDVPLSQLVTMGEIIADEAKKSGKKVALIASADQAHAHDKKGPYGYAKEAKEYDELIINIVKQDRLDQLLQIDKNLIEKAKPDSLWQMLILHGALKSNALKSHFLSYEVPTYFGMLVVYYD